MVRAVWKGPFFDINLITNFYIKVIKTCARYSVILPQFLRKCFFVYNGKKFIKVFIKEEMIGYKFGEFAWTKKTCIFKSKKVGKILKIKKS